MKRLLTMLLLVSGSFFGSCQCAESPDVPPVEETAAESSAPAETVQGS